MPDNPIKLSQLDEDELRFITPGLTYKNNRPEMSKLPSLADMKQLPNAELLQVLNHFQVFRAWETFVMANMAYVERLTNIAPGSQAMGLAVRALIDTSSRRALIGMSRRALEQWSTLEAVDGKVETEMIWMCLDDESSCQNCLDNDGEIDSMINWQRRGPPGSGVCEGGDYCRCSLIKISKGTV